MKKKKLSLLGQYYCHFLSFLREERTLLNRLVEFLSSVWPILLFLIIKSDPLLSFLFGPYLIKPLRQVFLNIV